mmetsp:Transcript_509/g.1124  ORF Transcript_509/g.1124 Transcript_509/m.1124 type:complete len:311 (-) Transcript_509:248-1180(-)
MKTSVSQPASSFTLDSVKALPAPPQVLDFGLTLEIVQAQCEQFFMRSFVNLNKFDGVRALHTQLSMMEFLEGYFEHRKDARLSPFPFSKSNVPGYGARNVANMLGFMGAMAGNKISASIQGGLCTGQRSDVDSASDRVFLRFNRIPNGVTYRQVEAIAEKAKTDLGFQYFASTVNFQSKGQSQVGLAVSRSLDELHSPEGRSRCLTMPPGAPPPIDDPVHIASMYDSVFFNNYGRHNPRISATVTDFCWDWTGCDARFSPICVTCSIQGRLFFQISAAAPAWDVVKEHFRPLGQAVESSVRPFLNTGASK